jgi:hypothetical protein
MQAIGNRLILPSTAIPRGDQENPYFPIESP